MIIAFRADLEVLFHLLTVDDPFAAVAFGPHPLRDAQPLVLNMLLENPASAKPGHDFPWKPFYYLVSVRYTINEEPETGSESAQATARLFPFP